MIKKILIGILSLVSIGGIYYFGIKKGTFKKLQSGKEQIIAEKESKDSYQRAPLPKQIDPKFLWRYLKKKNNRSIAMVTSRNKFNGEDISLGFRCDINSKKKALFLFGKFF